MEKIPLRDFGTETRESHEDAQAAGHENQQRDRVQPMAEANREGMLVGSTNQVTRFGGLKGNHRARPGPAHEISFVLTARRTSCSPGLPSSLCGRARW